MFCDDELDINHRRVPRNSVSFHVWNVAAFDGRTVSSDAGALLLGHADEAKANPVVEWSNWVKRRPIFVATVIL